MEEQRQRQEEEQRRAQATSAAEVDVGGSSVSGATATAGVTVEPSSDEAMLERALALSTETPVKRTRVRLILLFSNFFNDFFGCQMKFFHVYLIKILFNSFF